MEHSLPVASDDTELHPEEVLVGDDGLLSDPKIAISLSHPTLHFFPAAQFRYFSHDAHYTIMRCIIPERNLQMVSNVINVLYLGIWINNSLSLHGKIAGKLVLE